MNKYITIVVPVFKVEKYIQRCLESIYQTDESLFELIVVGDESPDESINIAKQVLAPYHNYQIISQKNKGLSGARNTGLSLVRTPYVWFVDSDDYICSEAIEYLNSVIETSYYDCVYFGFKYRYDDRMQDSMIGCKNKVVNGCQLLNVIGGEFSVWRNIYNVDFLRNNNLYFVEGLIFEDLDFNIRAFLSTDNIFVSDRYLYYYEQENMSSTLHATTYKHAWSMLWICMNLRKFWIDKLLSKAEYQVLCYHAGRAFNFAAQYYSQLEKNDRKRLDEYIIENKKTLIYILQHSQYRLHRIESILFRFLGLDVIWNIKQKICKQ